jgi:putative transposase
VNLAERRRNRLLVERIDVLRTAFRSVRARHPFRLEAVVILPDHLHCVWTLPPGDTDFSVRWSLIKEQFSRAVEPGERVSQSRAQGANGTCGSAVFGSTSSVTRTTSTGTWTTSTGTQ